MTPRRLDDMPDKGRVVVGHPALERAVALQAGKENLDYVLHRYAPTDSIYVLNMDAVNIDEWPWEGE